MPTIVENPNLVVGSGRCYFDQYNIDPLTGALTPTGEMYFGNTPELTLTQALTKLDHFSSDKGLREKDRSVSLQDDVTAKFSTDNVDQDNLALWWLGSASAIATAAAVGLTETIAFGQVDREFQIGESDAQPSGARNIANVAIKVFATAEDAIEAGENIGAVESGGTILPAANYDFDGVNGRFYVHNDAPTAVLVPPGSVFGVTYDQLVSTRELIVAAGAEIYGRFRFIAINQVGLNRNFFLPYVKITPQGDMALKGQTWQTMSFDMDVLKLPNRAKVYIDGGVTID